MDCRKDTMILRIITLFIVCCHLQCLYPLQRSAIPIKINELDEHTELLSVLVTAGKVIAVIRFSIYCS